MGMFIFFLSACVWDRTGQSMTTALRRQVQNNSIELEQVQVKTQNVTARIVQIEEVTRSRGRNEILKMENMDDLRTELANLRNDVEVMGFEATKQEQSVVALTEDSAYRLELLEERAQKLEKELGISAADSVSSTEKRKEKTLEKVKDSPSSTVPKVQEQEPTDNPTPEALLRKAKDHLAAGREVAAEAALRRHFSLYPKEKTHTEALYRYAEASFNQKKYQEAATRFQDVLNANAKSAFGAWALFRQGECFAALGDGESAKTFYEDVVKDYPKSKAAVEAKKRLSR
jgi:tol-pal system protein YbgF